jgi:hypothetical protein
MRPGYYDSMPVSASAMSCYPYPNAALERSCCASLSVSSSSGTTKFPPLRAGVGIRLHNSFTTLSYPCYIGSISVVLVARFNALRDDHVLESTWPTTCQ